MRGFTESELEAFAEKRERARRRFDKSLEDVRLIGTHLNEVHETKYTDKFWLYLLLPLVRKRQIQTHHDNLARKRQKIDGGNQQAKNLELSRISSRALGRFLGIGKRLLQQSIAGARYHAMRRSLKTDRTFVLGFHELPELESEATRLKAAYPWTITSPARHKRAKVNTLAANQVDLDIKSVVQDLPAYLVERFSDFVSRIPVEQAAQKNFHTSIGHGDFMTLVLALNFEYGASIIRYQHGSHYGEQECFDAVERLNCSEFHTWGWKSEERDVPDYAFRLDGFKRRYDAASDEPRLDLLLCFPALHQNNKERIKGQSLSILANLNYERYQNVVARPRPKGRHGNFAQQISFAKRENILVDQGNSDIACLIAQSNLVVHLQVPSTTFLECIFVDQPVMGLFWNLAPTEQVLPYYEFFLEKSVLHKDEDSLIKTLNEMVSVRKWWQSVMDDSMYAEFKFNFCRSRSSS